MIRPRTYQFDNVAGSMQFVVDHAFKLESLFVWPPMEGVLSSLMLGCEEQLVAPLPLAAFEARFVDGSEATPEQFAALYHGGSLKRCLPNYLLRELYFATAQAGCGVRVGLSGSARCILFCGTELVP